MKPIKHFFLLLVLIAPFFQGLYFLHQSYAVAIVILLLLGACYQLSGVIKVPKTPIFIVFVFIAVLHFILAIYGVDKGMAVLGGYRYLCYVLLYLLYAQIYSKELKEKTIDMMVYGNFIMSLTPILAIFFKSIYGHVFQYGRFGGFIQYANSYGILSLAAIVLIIRKSKYRVIDYIMIITITASLFLTYSRAVMLIGIVAIILTYIIKRRAEIKSILALFTGSMLAYSITMVLGLNQVGTRLSEVSLNVSEWKTRIIYYKDGLQIIRAYPFGIGYQSYNYVQKFFRTGALYHVKFIHNNLLQMIVDIGIVGGVLFIVLFFLLMLKKDIDLYSKLIVIILFGHGFIDFDFQFPIVFFMIIFLAFGENNTIDLVKRKRLEVIGFLVVLLGSYTLLFLGANAYQNGNYKKAYTLLPFYTEAKMDEINYGNSTPYYKAKLSEDLIQINPYLTSCYNYLRDYYYDTNDLEQSLYYAEKMVEYNPISLTSLEKYYEVIIAISQKWIDEGQESVVDKYIEIILNTPIYLQELAKEKNTDYNVKHKVSFTFTEKLNGYYLEALEIHNSIH